MFDAQKVEDPLNPNCPPPVQKWGNKTYAPVCWSFFFAAAIIVYSFFTATIFFVFTANHNVLGLWTRENALKLYESNRSTKGATQVQLMTGEMHYLKHIGNMTIY